MREVPAAHLPELTAKEGPKILALLQQAKALVKAPSIPPREKFERLTDIAEKISKTIVPYTPCKSGCSHCCNMAVAISDYEAEIISRYTGRALVPAGPIWEYMANSDAIIKKYAGVPCTFLAEDGKCEVYPVRPIACRAHHNLAADSENCRLEAELDELACTPVLNLMELHSAAIDVVYHAGRSFGDIRDYFPGRE